MPLCRYHSLFIDSSADEHLGCFHSGAVVNTAAMNMPVQISVYVSILHGYTPRSGIAGLYSNSVSLFEELPNCFPK